MSEEAVLDREKDPDLVSGESAVGAEADDAVGAVDRESAPAAGHAPRESSARRRFGIVEVVALIVIVVLAVALIVSRVQLSNQDSLNADRSSAVAAAKADAIDVATYSYLHLHRDFGKVEAESTPSFRRSFIRSSGGLSKVLVQYKATASAKVLTAAVQSISDSKAVVLLFVNQSVANSAQQGASTDDSRIEVTLAHSGNRWLLQDLKLL
jgi:Mce-associated membrane protein